MMVGVGPQYLADAMLLDVEQSAHRREGVARIDHRAHVVFVVPKNEVAKRHQVSHELISIVDWRAAASRYVLVGN